MPNRRAIISPASARKISWLVPRLLDWFAVNARDLPWRRSRDPYAIWVSEIMLQQTQVKTVLPYWERWMRAFPTVEALAAAEPDRVLKLWEGLGYYRRARHLHAGAKFVVQQFGGEFPRGFADILSLPGVGRYTAGAISSIAFNQPVPILDGNVIRVLTRLFGIRASTREKFTLDCLWRLAELFVQRAAVGNTPVNRHCARANQSLMELGALICTPRNPRCETCPVQIRCLAQRQNLVEEIPQLGKRMATTPRIQVAFVAQRAGRFAVRRRAEGEVNGNLWEFPNIEVPDEHFDALNLARQHFGATPARLVHLRQVRHTITRYRITVEFFEIEFAARAIIKRSVAAHWLRAAELAELAFPSAHGKIVQLLTEQKLAERAPAPAPLRRKRDP